MTQPSTERLVAALRDAGAPDDMIERAEADYYHDYSSPLAMPISQLVADARAAGLHAIAERAIAGEFDATQQESDAWAASPEGQEIMAMDEQRERAAERRRERAAGQFGGDQR